MAEIPIMGRMRLPQEIVVRTERTAGPDDATRWFCNRSEQANTSALLGVVMPVSMAQPAVRTISLHWSRGTRG